MARTTEVISAIIMDQVNTRLTANGITPSSSSVAEWKLWADTIAATIHAKEVIEDVFKADINGYLTNKQPAGIYWYVQQALAFQYGDNLVVGETGVLSYPVIDESKKIIQQASAREIDNGGYRELIIKVAKDDGSGAFVPLSNDEKLAFTNYMEVVKWAGTYIIVVSQNADLIKYNIDIKYDGIYAQSDVDARVLLALTAFKKSTRFDAIFYASSMLDTILQVPGVIAAKFNSLSGKPYGGSEVAVTLDYQLQSGYFNYDNTSALNYSLT